MFYFDILTDDVYSERTTDQQQVCRNQTSRGQQRTTPTAELHIDTVTNQPGSSSRYGCLEADVSDLQPIRREPQEEK